MQFDIDMSKVVKIVVEKDEDTLISYSINNGTIVDASIIKKEATLEEKVKNLKDNNEQVKTISKLIEFDKAGILDKMAQNGSDSVFETIKKDVEENPIENKILERPINVSSESQSAKDARDIMKLDGKMDEIAKASREKIAEHLFDENPNNENGIDKALEISDRNERLAYLKDIISKINNKNE